RRREEGPQTLPSTGTAPASAPQGDGRRGTPQQEPRVPEVGVPGERMLVGVIGGRDHVGLDEQPTDGEQPPVGGESDTDDPTQRASRGRSHPGRRTAPPARENERRD